MKKILLPVTLALLAACAPKTGWTEAELAIIGGELPLRVLTVNSPADSAFLRTPCSDLSTAEIQSENFGRLAAALLATVTDPSQDGVGIAGPQVGIGRRVVAVQRFDKAGEPFEVYPNIRITAKRGDTAPGPEGCLSVPGWRGQVMRWRDIDISYTSPATLRDTTEYVQGFSAVIFQHEYDHLDGVLYIDKVIEGTLQPRE